MDGVAGRAWTGMMDEVPLHKDSKLFRPYSGIKSTGIRSFFDSVFVKKEEGLYNPVFDSYWKKKSLYPLCLLGYSDFCRCFEL